MTREKSTVARDTKASPQGDRARDFHVSPRRGVGPGGNDETRLAAGGSNRCAAASEYKISLVAIFSCATVVYSIL